LAQEVIPPTGGTISGSTGSVSYTIGQIFYSTISGTTGFVIEGVQQPYEISLVTGINEASGINLVFAAFPNPTNDILYLKVENYETDNLYFQILDIRGNLLDYEKIQGTESSISLFANDPGVYFIIITDGKKQIKTFKIIKN
jgi:hypothetical protein